MLTNCKLISSLIEEKTLSILEIIILPLKCWYQDFVLLSSFFSSVPDKIKTNDLEENHQAMKPQEEKIFFFPHHGKI